MLRLIKTIWRGLWPEKHKGFKKGDIVRLKHQNPYKGTLNADRHYVVYGAGMDHVKLRNDNETTMSYYPAHLFEDYKNPIHRGTANRWDYAWHLQRRANIERKQTRRQQRADMIRAANERAEEYEEIMAAKEMMK